MAKLINNVSVCFFFLCLAAIAPRLLAHLQEEAAPDVPVSAEVGVPENSPKEADKVIVGSEDTPLDQVEAKKEPESEVEEQGNGETEAEGPTQDSSSSSGSSFPEAEKQADAPSPFSSFFSNKLGRFFP
ncbi:uncharacterized protein LOC123213072 [Mangifera indica]|uniref:uncharacterized protein LOC123213072 n=1 Tax=Mangifera indica TaxID=29780 RepID=UPI001CFA1D72|nr:uncharacterized protein LOC123213072 [Mangifera indica]